MASFWKFRKVVRKKFEDFVLPRLDFRRNTLGVIMQKKYIVYFSPV